MSERLQLQLAVLLSNTVTLICFALLAVFFKHWWLVLVSGLFMRSVQPQKKEE